MSTPMKSAPSQQGRTPAAAGTPPVSTPFSSGHAATAFSPPSSYAGGGGGNNHASAKSSSSPVAYKKSPANTSTLYGHASADRGVGTPSSATMANNSSVAGGSGGAGQHGVHGGGGAHAPGGGGSVAGNGGAPVNFDSPSAVAALGAMGMGAGLDLGGLDNVGLAGLGGPGTQIRSIEDERLKRLDAVLEILSHYTGRVSGPGLERLGKKAGLDNIWDIEGAGRKTNLLILAGKYLSMDIQLENNIVHKVSLAFPNSSEIVKMHEHKAGEILMNDLRLGPSESPLCKMLDKFAVNLERLALTDRLSESGSLDCFEAIAGIYESLERLHAWDVARLRDDPATSAKSDELILNTALATRHGLPAMHVRDRVGLSLDYWKDRWLVPPAKPTSRQFAGETEKTWAILVGCARAGEYHRPIRISDNWISTSVEVTDPTAADLMLGAAQGPGPLLDWQEPEETVISLKEKDHHHHMEVDDALGAVPKLPDVVFTATFDPPVTVPINVWEHLHELTESTPDFQGVTFDNLLFPIAPGSNYIPSETRTIERERDVEVVSRTGERSTRTHANTLFIYKPVYGRTLTQLPFAHPKQLISMLPCLRQCAFLATLLERSFPKAAEDGAAEQLERKKKPSPPPEKKTAQQKKHLQAAAAAAKKSSAADAAARLVGADAEIRSAKDEFADFLSEAAAPKQQQQRKKSAAAATTTKDGQKVQIDVTLIAHPTPRLEVVFPFRQRTANVLLEIALEGRVRVVAQNILPTPAGTSAAAAAVPAPAAGDGDITADPSQPPSSGGGGGGGGSAWRGVDAVGAGASAEVLRREEERAGRAKGKGRQVRPEDLARLLESCMDLDMWCEWIRMRLE